MHNSTSREKCLSCRKENKARQDKEQRLKKKQDKLNARGTGTAADPEYADGLCDKCTYLTFKYLCEKCRKACGAKRTKKYRERLQKMEKLL